eukprot:524254-Pelagomonas_calceolata.AAC.5
MCQAIANEAAVRLVALHRQNEGLADEKEELEVRSSSGRGGKRSKKLRKGGKKNIKLRKGRRKKGREGKGKGREGRDRGGERRGSKGRIE